MIEVTGEAGSPEYEAAEAIAEALEGLWTGIKNSPVDQDNVRIAANVKVSGYGVSDIDVVLCICSRRGRHFIPSRPVNDTAGNKVSGKPIEVQSLIVAIEVKDHDTSGVLLSGEQISVLYSRGAKRGWHSASDQNIKQVHALKGYFHDKGHNVFVHRCLIMRGVPGLDVAGAVGMGFSGIDLLGAITAASPVRVSKRTYSISSGRLADVAAIMRSGIFARITPTALDRRRMDAILASTPEVDQILNRVGTALVHLRGHGGTGKTVMCLQAARRGFGRSGMRTLVLTYNHALAADIRRLLALIGVASNPEEGGIAVATVMAFMTSWFRKLGITPAVEEFSSEQYAVSCQMTLDLIKGGAVSKEDIDMIIEGDPLNNDFDVIMVDEAQDWPQSEADLLKVLYDPRKLVVVDGIDQLLRGATRAAWVGNIPTEQRVTIPLVKCLRMKRNLAVFASKVASGSGVSLDITPNDEAGGGKVIMHMGMYLDFPALHSRLIAAARQAGNEEVDFLFCVPSSAVRDLDGGAKGSDIATYLKREGHNVWDGVDPRARKDFPRSRDQFRIVQYPSCRGLEGWIVILDRLDEYWEECKRVRESEAALTTEREAFLDLEGDARRVAFQKILIALTRPIDTLVIGIADPHSECAGVLLDIARGLSDFVEILE